MGPKPSSPRTDALFINRLDELINLKHPLVRLAGLIDWPEIERTFAASFTSGRGRPALPPRLVAGLLYLQHTFDASDEAVVNTWVENPYWQHFCGEVYLQTESPIDPSSLTRWRKRIGDTTVMPKAIAHPTDSRLLEKSRQHLVKVAEEHGIALRQNYNRTAPRLAAQIGRYAHAKQFKRMNKALRTLRTRVGRVQREVARQLDRLPEQVRAKIQNLLARTDRILAQRTKDKNKLYALHAPEVECISKGKARTPYEFGVKVSIATTLNEGLVVGMRSMPGNPYDGHTLQETLEQVGILTGTDRLPAMAVVDKGYRGVQIEGVRILMSGQKRGITRTLKAVIHRRSAIEPAIGHIKMDGRLGRNPLKGALGDALHAVMCGAGHNLRMILAKLRLLCPQMGIALRALLASLSPAGTSHHVALG